MNLIFANCQHSGAVQLVHQKDKEEATRKAAEIIAATLQKVRRMNRWRHCGSINRRVLVIGGGIAGMTGSLIWPKGI